MKLSSVDRLYVLRSYQESRHELYGKHIFITGGTGFIGKWMVASVLALIDEGNLDCRITILSRDAKEFILKHPYIGLHKAVRIIEGDVRDLVAGIKRYDYVIHAATDVLSPLSETQTLNVCALGTRSALRFAEQTGARVFLLVSSGAIYGSDANALTKIPEAHVSSDSDNVNDSAYARGKRIAEKIAREYQQNSTLNVVVARCFSFIGPHMGLDAHFAAGNFIMDALMGDEIHIKGDGTPLRTYLYSAELAYWLWMILLKGEDGDIYNVGGEEIISIVELAHIVAALLNPKAKVLVHRQPILKEPRHRYVPDIRHIKKKLALTQEIHTNEGITRTAMWLQQKNKFSKGLLN